MNAEKIRSHLRLPATSYENELDRGHRCAKAYFAHMKLGEFRRGALDDTRSALTVLIGDGYAPTDLQPADDLALLAGQAYVSAWTISGMIRSFCSDASGLMSSADRRARRTS